MCKAQRCLSTASIKNTAPKSYFNLHQILLAFKKIIHIQSFIHSFIIQLKIQGSDKLLVSAELQSPQASNH